MTRMRKAMAGKAVFAASAALLAVAVPSAGFAFGSLVDDVAEQAPDVFLAFTPANADPRLSEILAQRRSDARMMRFTPAGAAQSPAARSLTVAVRVDQQTADALAASSGIGSARGSEAESAGLRVTPTRYNLGLARGYSSFAQAAPAPARSIPTGSVSRVLSNEQIPDLSEFAPRTSSREEPSRFAARIALDEDRSKEARVSGESLSDQMLDVAGSYSLTRNLDITAGVRYEQDRDLIPVPNLDQQDSQAVYVGTQFRF